MCPSGRAPVPRAATSRTGSSRARRPLRCCSGSPQGCRRGQHPPRHRFGDPSAPPIEDHDAAREQPYAKPQPFSIQMGTPAHLVLAAPSRPRSSSSSYRNPHGVLSTANSDDLADYREHPDAMPVYDLPAPAPPCIRRPAVTKPTGEHPPSQSTYLRMR